MEQTSAAHLLQTGGQRSSHASLFQLPGQQGTQADAHRRTQAAPCFVCLFCADGRAPLPQCGVADGEGFLSLWQVNQTSSNPKPYLVSPPPPRPPPCMKRVVKSFLLIKSCSFAVGRVGSVTPRPAVTSPSSRPPASSPLLDSPAITGWHQQQQQQRAATV